MFTIDPIHPVYSAIIEMVAVYPNISIGVVHQKLQKNLSINISSAQLYRVITRMVDSQILIKIDGKLTVNLMWVSYVEFIASRAKKVLQNTDDFPLRVGEKKIYTANSLLDLEAIWNHILVSLYRLLQEKNLFKYYSHAWWQLGRNAEEIDFYRQLQTKGIECHWVFGSNTFLDQHGANRIREVFPAVTLNEAPFPKEGYSLAVYGEYIIESIMPEKTIRNFSHFFHSTTSIEGFDEDLFLDIFAMRAKYKLSVWRNAKQAALLQKKLHTFFCAR